MLGRLSLDSPSPAIKQLPLAATLTAALGALAISPELQTTNPFYAWLGVAIIATATILSILLPWKRLPHWVTLVIPISSILGIAFFRQGTGGLASIFGALVLLPVIWIATEEGRRYIVIATASIAIYTTMPFLLDAETAANGQILRAFFTPVVYFVVASILNELSHRARVQLASAQALIDEREARLDEAAASARALEESRIRLTQAEQFSRSIWDGVTAQSVIVTDLTGLIVAWNRGAEKLFGVSHTETENLKYMIDFHDPEELMARMVDFIDPTVDPFTNRAMFPELVAGARGLYGDDSEWTYMRPDGSTIPVQLSGTPRLDENDHVVGFIFLAIDLTDAKEVAKLKDQFVGLVSHELRTPLTSILGYLELMDSDPDQPLSDEQRHYLRIAERNAGRLKRLVGDLLFTAQVEGGQFPVSFVEVDLHEVVWSSIESARVTARRAGVALVAELSNDDVRVEADPMRVGQVSDNLISNAIKFTPVGGTVTVTLDYTQTGALIGVADTGIGIPEAEVDRLFTRFFRTSTAMRQAVPGIGLGLSITKTIVETHHGSMGVTSVEGEGTVFTVSLPYTQPEPEARAAD